MIATRTRPAIAAAGLRQAFGRRAVLDGVNVEVAQTTELTCVGLKGRRADPSNVTVEQGDKKHGRAERGDPGPWSAEVL